MKHENVYYYPGGVCNDSYTLYSLCTVLKYSQGVIHMPEFVVNTTMGKIEKDLIESKGIKVKLDNNVKVNLLFPIAYNYGKSMLENNHLMNTVASVELEEFFQREDHMDLSLPIVQQIADKKWSQHDVIGFLMQQPYVFSDSRVVSLIDYHMLKGVYLWTKRQRTMP